MTRRRRLPLTRSRFIPTASTMPDITTFYPMDPSSPHWMHVSGGGCYCERDYREREPDTSPTHPATQGDDQ